MGLVTCLLGLNLTMAQPHQAEQSMVHMKERLKILEEYVARPQPPQLDARALGTRFARE